MWRREGVPFAAPGAGRTASGSGSGLTPPLSSVICARCGVLVYGFSTVVLVENQNGQSLCAQRRAQHRPDQRPSWRASTVVWTSYS